MRLAVVDKDKCRPKDCQQECRKGCPVNRTGKKCIEVDTRATISELLCIGCNICTKKCPFNAIKIINVAGNMTDNITHQYGPNTFRLYNLPIPKKGKILGLVGANGIGKTTAMNILSKNFIPNMGSYDEEPNKEIVINAYKGSELHEYLRLLYSEDANIRIAYKIQNVNLIPKMKYTIGKTVREILNSFSDSIESNDIVCGLDMEYMLDKFIIDLSGGELQKLTIAVTLMRNKTICILDEPTSFLDIRQRIMVAKKIREACYADDNVYYIVAEHDLSIIDYLSDYISLFYGSAGSYGCATYPKGTAEGINQYLDGFLPNENFRMRDYAVSFKMRSDDEYIPSPHTAVEYSEISVVNGTFTLTITPGRIQKSEIILLLGENGMGKSTFVKVLAGKIPSSNGTEVPRINISYKPQEIIPTVDMTVAQLLNQRAPNWTHPQFKSYVADPLLINELLDRFVKDLSGGELQRVAIVMCLGKPADVYLLDEPSAYLDSEMRIAATRAIKRFIHNSKKSAFIVEHDFIMATHLADRIIVFEGEKGVNCVANSPIGMCAGMNKFLEMLDVTFRRDSSNYRPRINKLGSVKDREQKATGNYFINDVV